MKFRLHRRNGLLLAAIVSSVSAGVAWNHSSSTRAPGWQADESSHELAESDAALKARLQAEALREEIAAAEFAESKNKLLKAHMPNLPVNPESIAAHPEALVAPLVDEATPGNVEAVLPAAETVAMVDEVVSPAHPVALASVMRGGGFDNRVGAFYTASARDAGAGEHGSPSDPAQEKNDGGPQAAPSEVPPVIAGHDPEEQPGQQNPGDPCNDTPEKCKQDPNNPPGKKDVVDVDEPGSLALFSLGLLGLAARSSRKKAVRR